MQSLATHHRPHGRSWAYHYRLLGRNWETTYRLRGRDYRFRGLRKFPATSNETKEIGRITHPLLEELIEESYLTEDSLEKEDAERILVRPQQGMRE